MFGELGKKKLNEMTKAEQDELLRLLKEQRVQRDAEAQARMEESGRTGVPIPTEEMFRLGLMHYTPLQKGSIEPGEVDESFAEIFQAFQSKD